MFDPRMLFAIALGGGAGSILRHIASTALQNAVGAPVFPWGILTVNIAGCLLIGMITQFGESTALLTPVLRSLLITGFLGGFTTYSTFASQSYDLASGGMALQSALYIGLHVVCGFLAVWLGRTIVLHFVG